jgi:hypothetical protein
MLEFTPPLASLPQRAFALAGCALAAATLWVFVACLPPFQMGLWFQSEPVMVADFAFAALTAAWLCAGLATGWIRQGAPHPLWRVLALWLVWQLLVTAGSRMPWLSWFGPPEIGEGTARFIALWLLCLLMSTLWGQHRRFLLLAASGSLLVQCTLHGFNPFGPEHIYEEGTWVPAKFPAYLAFMGASLWLAACAGGYANSTGRRLLMAAFLLLVIRISQNKSAMVLLTLPLLAGFALQHRVVTPRLRYLAAAACAAPLLFVAYCGVFSSTLTLDRDSGLGSRVALYQASLSTLRHEPARLLYGGGWGRFGDDAFKYALVDGVYVFKNAQRAPNWSALEGDAYHSHSMPLEVLLSLGLPGLALWFAVPALLLLRLPAAFFWSCAPVLAGVTMLASLWFELPQCIGFDALALAALAGLSPGARRPAARPRMPATLAAVCCVLMALSSLAQHRVMHFNYRLADAAGGLPYTDYPLEWLAGDLPRGGNAIRAVALLYAAKLQDRDAIDANMRGWYALVLNAAHIAATGGQAGARVASTELWMQYKLMIDFGGFRSFAELGHQVALAITDSMLNLLRIAPLRDDYATFYLLNIDGVTRGDARKKEAILRQMLAIAPLHRPALWLLGKHLGNAEGKALMTKAARLGVDTVYPVTDRELKAARDP